MIKSKKFVWFRNNHFSPHNLRQFTKLLSRLWKKIKQDWREKSINIWIMVGQKQENNPNRLAQLLRMPLKKCVLSMNTCNRLRVNRRWANRILKILGNRLIFLIRINGVQVEILIAKLRFRNWVCRRKIKETSTTVSSRQSRRNGEQSCRDRILN